MKPDAKPRRQSPAVTANSASFVGSCRFRQQQRVEQVHLAGRHEVAGIEHLLPDSDDIRRRVAERFKTGSTEPFDLLKAIGRDCVGALQLLGEDEEPTNPGRVEGIEPSERDIEQHLAQVTAPRSFGAAPGRDEDLRISLAGAQEKTALCRWGGKWLLPRGSTPTTHILKLPLGLVGGRRADFSPSVDNEWLCLRLLRAYGIPVPSAEIAQFGTQRVLVVERFDRRIAPDGQSILRLPQEDFCQIAGVPPYRKYESDGGPGLMTLFATLRQSERTEADMRVAIAAQILFWLMRAPDGHAKNFSVRLLPGGRFRLTPLYDVMSVYPILGDGPNQWSPREVTMAMALFGKNRHYRMHEITRRHFNSTARQVGFGDDAEALIEALVRKTPQAIAEVRADLPHGFNPHVAETILEGVRRAAEALQAMPAW